MRLRLLLITLVGFGLAGCASGATSPGTSEPLASITTAPVATTTTASQTTTTTEPPPTLIRGRVIGPDLKPLAGVRISSDIGEMVTSKDGMFEVEASPSSLLSVSKPGWTEVSLESRERFTHVSLEPRTIRALRVGADAAGDESAFDRMLDLAGKTAVNAFVFDTKQEGGKVVYNTEVAAAHESGAVADLYDPVKTIAQAHEHGLYAITRVVVFEDSYRVAAFPEDKLAGGWVDPRSTDAWRYNIDLAVEACELGFDEIQFDYVRFPSGRTAQVSGQLDLSQAERIAAIEGFLEAARSELIPLGCAVSADIFAIVVSVPNDQGLGQRPEELSRQLDAVSPMVYPSHYSDGWLGFADPNDFPYEVTADAIDDALPRLEPGTVLRPWLQAFWWTNAQIRLSIQAAEDRGVGWILWNARSNFDIEALPTDDEVSD